MNSSLVHWNSSSAIDVDTCSRLHTAEFPESLPYILLIRISHNPHVITFKEMVSVQHATIQLWMHMEVAKHKRSVRVARIDRL